MQKVLDKLLSWQDVRARLRAQTNKADKRLTEHRKEINRLHEELKYFKPGSRDHKKRQTDVAQRQYKLATLGTAVRRAFAERSRAALKAAKEAVRKAVRNHAIANDLAVVVDARALLYFGAGADISLKVAREMNRQYKELKAKEQSPGRVNRKKRPTENK